MIQYDSAQRYFTQAYMLRETIPDFHLEVERWEALGQSLHDSLESKGWSTKTLSYGDHSRQDLQLFRAEAGKTGKGLAVFIHGGFWRMMDRAQSHFMAQPYLERGWDCAVLEYRLMPEYRLSELIEDTVSALQKLHQHDKWPKRILSGHSAGAHLAWHGGLAARASGASSADDALMLISPVFDIFAVLGTPIIGELNMPIAETAQWSCYHGFEQADQPVQFVVGGSETEDFKRQAYIGAQMMGRGDQQNIALIDARNHLSVVSEIATNPQVFEQLHKPLGL